MILKSTMIIVTDINKSVEFYKKILELNVIMDFGANKTLTGNLVLQTIETYKEFIDKNNISLEEIILKYILKKMILIILLIN